MSFSDDVQEAIKNLESRLNIREGFLDDLLNEDDWSFVIKSHAFLESVISTLITDRVGYTTLIDIFARLEIGNKFYGKIAFIKELDILKADERRFITSLSGLRNSLIHNVSNINFTFEDYIKTLDTNQKKKFINSFGYCYLKEDENGVKKVENEDRILAAPKESIWQSFKYIIAICSIIIDTIRLEKEAEMGKKEAEKLKDKRLSLQEVLIKKYEKQLKNLTK